MNKAEKKEPLHCDEYVWGFASVKGDANEDLKWFLFVNRQPAILKVLMLEKGVKDPVLFADHQGKRVRVVMASRFGDVGITNDLKAERGYDLRVSIEDLSNFSSKE